MKAALPNNEMARLGALHDLQLLDTPKEQSFDDIAVIAAQICEVPAAVISLIDMDRQWFKACVGLVAQQTPRDQAFCAHAILHPGEPLVVTDALHDFRFADNPLVLGAPGIRFYAGIPLVTADGYALGTLCVIDYKPRQLLPAQMAALSALARQVIKQIELRQAISERQVQEGILLRERERFRLMYELLPVAIYLITGDGKKFLNGNPEFFRLTGYREQDLRVPNSRDRMPLHLFTDEEIAQLVKGQRVGPRERELICKDQRRIPVSVEAVIINTVQGEQQILAIIQDISERKRNELMKNEFVSSVSHELRTPLTSISGALGLLVNESLGSVPEVYKTMLDIAYKNSKRLTLLIDDLLDMEKLLAGKIHINCRPFPVIALLEKSLYEITNYAQNYGIRFDLRAPVDKVLISVDENRFLQVMNNLLSNAIKFSPRESPIEISAGLKNDCVIISVRDFGPGIPQAFQARIFQKFSQADASDARRKGGTGLGLAISRELVEKMNGKISFTSEPGAGACFYLEFPIVNLSED